MKVIFLVDVPRVGRKHDVKEVNGGYAMNFLIPRKLAVVATPQAVAELELRKQEIIVEREVQDELLGKNLESIKDKVVHLKAKADEKGHLFSGIHKKDLVEALRSEHRAEIHEDFLVLDKPIKELGEFTVPIQIRGKNSSVKVVVESI